MSTFSDVGKLMHLPLEDIQPDEPATAPEFIIAAAAESLLKADGHNWVPVIVKQTGKYEYQVVANSFVYAVAEQAGLERVWAIVTNSDSQTVELTKVLAGESVPKVNLSTASRDTIMAALRYLIGKPGSPLKAVKLLVAVDKVAEAADRQYWRTFEPVSQLKCGITKAKVPALKKVFYLSPEPIPQPPETVSIKRASREEILARLKYLAKYQIGGFEKVDSDEAADLLFNASKGKWKSLNPVAELACGITKAQIKTLKTVFTV